MRIISGMHRSGTSFLAQAFTKLEADFGPPELLFPADFWNQNGYFENIEVVDINNQLILGGGTLVELWLKAPEHGLGRLLNSLKSRKWKYFLKPSVAGINRRAKGFEDGMDRLHETYRGIYVKDPRFCLTLGAWAARGPVEGIVLSFRNPWAVAASVHRREKLPMYFGYQQWLYHMRGFWSQVPCDVPVFLVDFDRFFDGDRQAGAFDRLIRYCGYQEDLEARREELIAALDLRLRHHDEPNRQMPHAITQAYAGLQHLYEACGSEGILPDAHPEELAAILNGTALR